MKFHNFKRKKKFCENVTNYKICSKKLCLKQLQKIRKLASPLERFKRMKWHFRNEENEFDLDQFKPKPGCNPRNIKM